MKGLEHSRIDPEIPQCVDDLLLFVRRVELRLAVDPEQRDNKTHIGIADPDAANLLLKKRLTYAATRALTLQPGGFQLQLSILDRIFFLHALDGAL